MLDLSQSFPALLSSLGCCMQLLTQADTSLDEDLQLLARHAAPADRGFYANCLTAYSEVGAAQLETTLNALALCTFLRLGGPGAM